MEMFGSTDLKNILEKHLKMRKGQISVGENVLVVSETQLCGRCHTFGTLDVIRFLQFLKVWEMLTNKNGGNIKLFV